MLLLLLLISIINSQIHYENDPLCNSINSLFCHDDSLTSINDCNGKGDLYIIIENSDYICRKYERLSPPTPFCTGSDTRCEYQRIKNFTGEILCGMNVVNDYMHVGMIQYSGRTTYGYMECGIKEFELNGNKNDVLKSIENCEQYIISDNHLEEGLELAYNSFSINGRDEVNKYLLIIVNSRTTCHDGTIDCPNDLIIANKLKNELGVSIVVVGIDITSSTVINHYKNNVASGNNFYIPVTGFMKSEMIPVAPTTRKFLCSGIKSFTPESYCVGDSTNITVDGVGFDSRNKQGVKCKIVYGSNNVKIAGGRVLTSTTVECGFKKSDYKTGSYVVDVSLNGGLTWTNSNVKYRMKFCVKASSVFIILTTVFGVVFCIVIIMIVVGLSSIVVCDVMKNKREAVESIGDQGSFGRRVYFFFKGLKEKKVKYQSEMKELKVTSKCEDEEINPVKTKLKAPKKRSFKENKVTKKEEKKMKVNIRERAFSEKPKKKKKVSKKKEEKKKKEIESPLTKRHRAFSEKVSKKKKITDAFKSPFTNSKCEDLVEDVQYGFEKLVNKREMKGAEFYFGDRQNNQVVSDMYRGSAISKQTLLDGGNSKLGSKEKNQLFELVLKKKRERKRKEQEEEKLVSAKIEFIDDDDDQN